MESCEFWLAAMVLLLVHGQMSLLDALYIEVIFRAKPSQNHHHDPQRLAETNPT
jgi:hypothetical protein